MKKLIFVFSLFFLLSACFDNEPDPLDCATVVCTAEFVSFSVTVKNIAGEPISLDSFTVSEVVSGDDLTFEYTPEELAAMQLVGEYPLYDDRFVAKHFNQSIEIVFKGVDDGEEIVNATYFVGSGCCHVGIDSGNLNIITN